MEIDDQAVNEAIYRAVRKVKPSLADYPMDPQTDLRTLGLDSIELMTVEFELEDALDITIVDRYLDAFRTVEEARAVIQGLLREKDSEEKDQPGQPA